jgi:hypothetical protein
LTIAVIIGVCVLLLVLGFLAPRLADWAHRGADKPLAAGQRGGSKAPGPLGRLFSKSFGKSRSAQSKSKTTGQRARGKLPL